MTKLEAYKEAKRQAEEMRTFADEVNRLRANAHGPDVYWVDKFYGRVRIDEPRSGVYGSSSTFMWSENVLNLMQEAATRNLRKTALDAAALAEARAYQRRLEAKAEAEEVLREV